MSRHVGVVMFAVYFISHVCVYCVFAWSVRRGRDNTLVAHICYRSVTERLGGGSIGDAARLPESAVERRVEASTCCDGRGTGAATDRRRISYKLISRQIETKLIMIAAW